MKKNILIPMVTALLLAAIVAVYFVPLGASAKEISIKLYEFGYQLEDGDFPLKLKAGEVYTFKVVNIGGVEHELMIVTDPDFVIQDIKSAVNEYISQGVSIDDIDEKLDEEHHEFEERWVEAGVYIEGVKLGPGEETTFEVKIDQPGTYYMVCLVFKGSAPDTHADRGMIAEVIVEA